MSLRLLDMGLVPYENALKEQENILTNRIADLTEDTVLLLEHYPVVTLGRSFNDTGLRDADFFARKNISIVRADRGGGITYHSPGQLVIYPIVRIDPASRDISSFIDILEIMVVAALGDLGVDTQRDPFRRGVWATGKKIAFTGIKFKRWVSCHGVAVNINNDISAFEMMDPCGEPGTKVTSASILSGKPLDMNEVKKVFSVHLERVFS